MITNTGKNILGKYLVGQIPTYAGYIAVGCGSQPVTSFGNYASKTELDFEMFRIPITSKGYTSGILTGIPTNATTDGTYITYIANNTFAAGQIVTITGIISSGNTGGTAGTGFNLTNAIIYDASTTQFRVPNTLSDTFTSATYGLASVSYPEIVLSAELPTLERYEITEIGIYPGQYNQNTNLNSFLLYNFSTLENWQYYIPTSSAWTPTTLKTVSIALDANNSSNNLDTQYADDAVTVVKAYQTNTDNSFFTSSRIARYERPRFLNSALIIKGDMSSDLTDLTSTYIGISGNKLNLDNASSLDKIKIVLSLINSSGSSTSLPSGNTTVKLVFYCANGIDYATATFVASGLTATTNRYVSISQYINQITKTSGFSWSTVNSTRVYANVVDSGSPSASWAIALDGVRFENSSSTSSVYGLVGYAPIKSSTAATLIKNNNTSGFIEFRFGLGVS
jgi:hypothetical protein